MKRLAALILSVMLTAPVFAGIETGADFLKIPIGARAVAMGEAFTALADETDALNWNVAGIAPSGPIQAAGRVSLSHQIMLLGNTLDHLSLAMPRGVSGFGFSVTRLAYPAQEARDENRNLTGSFGASDLSAGVAYAAAYGGVRVGTQVKYLQESIASQNASGFAVDIGLLSRTPLSRLNVGASIRNLGPSMQFISERFNLPLTISVGSAYRLTGPLILAVDLQNRPYDRQTAVSIGTEFSATSAFSLRAGYLAKLASAISNSQQTETNRGLTGGIAGINAGFGLKFGDFNLDYAMTPFGELGDVHSLTLSTAFGGKHSGDLLSSPRDDQSEKSTPETERTIIIFDQSGSNQPLNPSR